MDSKNIEQIREQILKDVRYKNKVDNPNIGGQTVGTFNRSVIATSDDLNIEMIIGYSGSHSMNRDIAMKAMGFIINEIVK